MNSRPSGRAIPGPFEAWAFLNRNGAGQRGLGQCVGRTSMGKARKLSFRGKLATSFMARGEGSEWASSGQGPPLMILQPGAESDTRS